MSKICKQCNSTFTPKRRDMAFCSTSCRNKAYYERRIEKEPEHPKKMAERRKIAIEDKKAFDAWMLEERKRERLERIEAERQQVEMIALARQQGIEDARREAIAEAERAIIQAEEREQAEQLAAIERQKRREHLQRKRKEQEAKRKEDAAKLVKALKELFGK